MSATLDAILATLSVVLGLALVVQGIQQVFKQWLDLKSNYMRIQLLAMFDPGTSGAVKTFRGLGRVTSMAGDADPIAEAAVRGIEAAVRTFGYKDLELLTHLDADQFKSVVRSIDWLGIPGAAEAADQVATLAAKIDLWFDLAKRGFQDMYERRMRVWSFFTSLVVVIALNAGIFDIYSQFTVNAPLREAAISWAEQRTAASRDTSDRPSIGSDQDRVRSLRAHVDSLKSILGAEGFQVLGWRPDTFTAPGTAGWVGNWVMTFCGWLLMTVLVSLGAPFWYDLLRSLLGMKNRMQRGGEDRVSVTLPRTPQPEMPAGDEMRPAVG
jgi:hypothetical protein